MNVTVKLGAALARFRPAEAARNTFSLQVPENGTAQDVLDCLTISTDQPVMLIINDTLISPEQRPKHHLTENDTVAVMTPIHAG